MKSKLLAITVLLVNVLNVYSQNMKQLSREEAIADIDSLIYTISEVHPDMFFTCKPGEFLKTANGIKNSLPDSVTAIQMYSILQPLIAKIGDGHTSMCLPLDYIKAGNNLRIPVKMSVTPELKIKVESSVDNKIPTDCEITRINDISAKEMLRQMICTMSGETEAYKISMVREYFSELFLIMYPAETYDIDYREPEKRIIHNIKLLPCTNNYFLTWEKTSQKPKKTASYAPYSFKILPEENVAIMDFKSFENPEYMTCFADSMFTTLKQKNIQNLIIDITENGGGHRTRPDELS